MFWLFWKLSGPTVHEGISGNVNDLAATAGVRKILDEPGLDRSLFPGVVQWSPSTAVSARAFMYPIPVMLTQSASFTEDVMAALGQSFVQDRIARAPVSADGTIGEAETLFLTRLRGNRQDNLIAGTDGPDDIFGLAGNDTLRGGDKSDFLYGGAGNDVLEGEGGLDRLWGGDGRDRLFGGDGNDTLWGGKGADVLFGGAGSDVIYGGAGRDRIFTEVGEAYGGAGNDTIEGDGTFFGDTEDDMVAGSGRFYGGRGSDVLILRATERLEHLNSFGADFYGGAGRDRFVFVIDAKRPVAAVYTATIWDIEPGEVIDLSQTGLRSFEDLRVNRFVYWNGTETTIRAKGPMANAPTYSELRPRRKDHTEAGPGHPARARRPGTPTRCPGARWPGC